MIKPLRLQVPSTVFLDVYLDDGIEEKVVAVPDSLIFDPSDR